MAATKLLLFYGAGASMPPPTLAPAFQPLTSFALQDLGWRWKKEKNGIEHPHWVRHGYPDIDPPWEAGMPPEVVFRVLDELHIGFARPVERLMTAVDPNAAHVAAASLFAAGGCVWTPNIDTAIERAWAALPAVRGGRVARSLGTLKPVPGGIYPERSFADAGPNTLVKFHGSADAHGTLAFTDRQLLTPLPPSEIDHLTALAAGKHLAFYGYQGADLDLRDLLVAAMREATQVTWFVVARTQRDFVARTFAGLPIEFLPRDLDEKMDANLKPCAEAFLDLLDNYELATAIEPHLRDLLGETPKAHRGPKRPDFRFKQTGLVQTALVERFGDPNEHRRAFEQAVRDDLRHPSLTVARTLPAYVDFALTYSLYHGGGVAKIVQRSADQLAKPAAQRVADLPLLRRYRDYVLDKGTALLLSGGRWRELLALTDYAVSVRRTPDGRPQPNDQYYRGHALRYNGQIDAAREAQRAAEAGLTGVRWRRADPERLVGAVLEQGMLDLYQGLFENALPRADDLKNNRGRYAIQRWASWGYWLEGMAQIYLLDLDAAAKALETGGRRFEGAQETQHVNDIRIAEMFASRVAMALGARTTMPSMPVDDELSARQRDDARLVRADIALAEGNTGKASKLVDAILAAPSNTLAALWAELVRDEIARVGGAGHNRFACLRDEAQRRGARWLELQATAGLVRAGEATESDWDTAAAGMQLGNARRARELQLGAPPLLWAVT